MRTLPPALAAAVVKTMTQPGYLIEIGFSTPVRLSTLGDVSYAGHAWAAGYKVQVQGVAWALGAKPKITLGNFDLAFGALALNEGVADRPVKIYAVDGAAPDDALLVFDGVGDTVEVGDTVVIGLAQRNARALYSPRRFIGPSSGFNHLMPDGFKVVLGGATYVFSRGR